MGEGREATGRAITKRRKCSLTFALASKDEKSTTSVQTSIEPNNMTSTSESTFGPRRHVYAYSSLPPNRRRSKEAPLKKRIAAVVALNCFAASVYFLLIHDPSLSSRPAQKNHHRSLSLTDSFATAVDEGLGGLRRFLPWAKDKKPVSRPKLGKMRRLDHGIIRKLANVTSSTAIPEYCYTNMISNGDFALGTTDWTKNQESDMYPDFDMTTADIGDGSFAVTFTDRYERNQGPAQDITASAAPCLANGTEPFYWRMRFDVQMHDIETGGGVQQCRDDRWTVEEPGGFKVRSHLACPYIKLVAEGVGGQKHLHVHDISLDWDPTAGIWNHYDITFQLPENWDETIGSLNCALMGGPPSASVSIKNVELARVDESIAIEYGLVIWWPWHPVCRDNMFHNWGKSTFGWVAWGSWYRDSESYTIDYIEDAVSDASDGDYYIASNRVHPTNQGLGQKFNGGKFQKCYNGANYYMFFTALVALKNETTFDAVNPDAQCIYSNSTGLDKYKCPRMLLYVTRAGEPHLKVTLEAEDILKHPQSWDPHGWNPIEFVVAMHANATAPPIISVNPNFMGGPEGSVLLLKDPVARRLEYEDLPYDDKILPLVGVYGKLPIKPCYSYGDPHFVSFGGTKFDHHEHNAWTLMYEQGDLGIEVHQIYTNYAAATINDAVRITYQGHTYIYSGGTIPSSSDPHSPSDGKLSFPDPELSVEMVSRFFKGQWYYNIWIVTRETWEAVGGCIDNYDGTPSLPETPVIYPEGSPTEAEAEAICEELRGTSNFESCVFDVRMVNDPEGAASFLASSTELEETQRTLMEDTHAVVVEDMGGVVGDPLIVGLNGQFFKFEGRDSAWYANLASESLQWNMKFKRFPGLPAHEDMFVTGLGISLFDTNKELIHGITIQVRDEAAFFPGCGRGASSCLGEGSLEIVVDGTTPITQPGDFYGLSQTGDLRIIAFNTFASCSRKWHDFQEPEEHNGRDGARSLKPEKRPIDFLLEEMKEERMVNAEACALWLRDREDKGDLFLQAGGWTSIIIETPIVSFHVEYRQSHGHQTGVPSHSIDAWMSSFGPIFKRDDWQGILGETRYKKFYDDTGEQITGSRAELLRGGYDSNYEVDGPYGLDFAARRTPRPRWLRLPAMLRQGAVTEGGLRNVAEELNLL